MRDFGAPFSVVIINCLLGLTLAGCSSGPADIDRSTASLTRNPVTITPAPPMITPTASPTATASSSPAPTIDPPPSLIGPDYKRGFNPLTGQAVEDPQTLFRVPLLVSITEFPPSARPQAGLSFADQVWETSIGQGMTRFLAVFYGDYMERFKALSATDPKLAVDSTFIGPVRSGRIGYEQIKDFYPGSLLFIRSASPQVAEQLTDTIIVYAADTEDVNSATLSLAELEALDIPSAGPADYAGLIFDDRIPGGGDPADSLSIIYNLYDQIEWTYDPVRGEYLRSQDPADGSGELKPSLDRLNGSRLAADNVVVMFAQHTFENRGATIVGIELAYVPKRHGILFRNGKMYDVTWSSPRSMLSFIDETGRPIAFKPGNTYFEVVSYESTWDSTKRIVRFHNPPLPTEPPPPILTPKPTKTPTPSETVPG